LEFRAWRKARAPQCLQTLLHRSRVRASFKIKGQAWQVFAASHHVGHGALDRVGRSYASLSEAHVGADLAGSCAEQMRSANIRDEPDGGFGHNELRAFRDDAMRSVAGDTDAAATSSLLDSIDSNLLPRP
jgi:hypothetical protein